MPPGRRPHRPLQAPRDVERLRNQRQNRNDAVQNATDGEHQLQQRETATGRFGFWRGCFIAHFRRTPAPWSTSSVIFRYSAGRSLTPASFSSSCHWRKTARAPHRRVGVVKLLMPRPSITTLGSNSDEFTGVWLRRVDGRVGRTHPRRRSRPLPEARVKNYKSSSARAKSPAARARLQMSITSLTACAIGASRSPTGWLARRWPSAGR